MKKKILLIVILILPIFIDAKINNDYVTSSNYANKYISIYPDNKLYILRSESGLEIPYKYENNVLSSVSKFKNGGLLNLDEFRKSKDRNGNTYLYTGNNYWTMTENSSKVYIIDNSSTDNELLTDKASLSGTRVTEYIRENTGVTGIGTYNDPWMFVERYEVSVMSADTAAGDVSPKTYAANKGEDVEIRILPNSEYNYDRNNCDAIYQNNKIIIRNVTKNISCKVYFKKKQYTLTYNNNGGNGCTSKTMTSGSAWGTLCTPHKTNYEFIGWYDSRNNKITATSIARANITVKAKWQYSSLKLTYNNNGGSGCTSKTISKGVKVGLLCNPSKTANQFEGWYTSATGGTRVTEDSTFNSATTIYAHWSPSCFDFKTSTGTITDYYDYKGNNSSNGSCSRSVTIPSKIGVTRNRDGSEDKTTVVSYGGSKRYNVVVPSTVTNIDDYAYYENSITSITIPNGVTRIGNLGLAYNNINTINIPSTVTYIGELALFANWASNINYTSNNLTFIGTAAFNANSTSATNALKYKKKSDGTDDLTTVVSYSSQRKNITIPSTVTKIDDSAFFNTFLYSVNIPEGVTYIGHQAFDWCYLSSVTIPSSVTTIENRAFNKYYDKDWRENINPLTKVINKTGKSFDWHYIINAEYYNDDTQNSNYYLKKYSFETGTVLNPRGNVTITK